MPSPFPLPHVSASGRHARRARQVRDAAVTAAPPPVREPQYWHAALVCSRRCQPRPLRRLSLLCVAVPVCWARRLNCAALRLERRLSLSRALNALNLTKTTARRLSAPAALLLHPPATCLARGGVLWGHAIRKLDPVVLALHDTSPALLSDVAARATARHHHCGGDGTRNGPYRLSDARHRLHTLLHLRDARRPSRRCGVLESGSKNAGGCSSQPVAIVADSIFLHPVAVPPPHNLSPPSLVADGCSSQPFAAVACCLLAEVEIRRFGVLL